MPSIQGCRADIFAEYFDYLIMLLCKATIDTNRSSYFYANLLRYIYNFQLFDGKGAGQAASDQENKILL